MTVICEQRPKRSVRWVKKVPEAAAATSAGTESEMHVAQRLSGGLGMVGRLATDLSGLRNVAVAPADHGCASVR